MLSLTRLHDKVIKYHLGRSFRGHHDLQLQDSKKVSNNFIIKMTESDSNLHAAKFV